MWPPESGRESSQSICVLAAALVSLPLTFQVAVGLAAVISSWNILVFTWTVTIPALQILSGVLFLPVLFSVWQLVFNKQDSLQETKIRSSYFGLLGLTAVNLLIFLLSCALLLTSILRPMADSLKVLIKLYPYKRPPKLLLDEIQARFYCCGASDITNWFYSDWQNVDIEPGHIVDLSSGGWDAVPFSCCSREAAPPCIHEGLKGFGLGSVYNTGCASALTIATCIYLAVCAVIALMALPPLAWLLREMRRRKHDTEQPEKKSIASESNSSPLKKEARVVTISSPDSSSENQQDKRKQSDKDRGDKPRRRKNKLNCFPRKKSARGRRLDLAAASTDSSTSEGLDLEDNNPFVYNAMADAFPPYLQTRSIYHAGEFPQKNELDERETVSDTVIHRKQDISPVESHILLPPFQKFP